MADLWNFIGIEGARVGAEYLKGMEHG